MRPLLCVQAVIARLAIFIVLLLSGSVHAQIKSWNYRHYTSADGLPGNRIIDVAQDKDGFIWIASNSGLCRFDGDEFVTLYHDSRDSTSLPSDYVNYVAAAPNGSIITSTLKGLYVLNPKTMRGYTIHRTHYKGWEAVDDYFSEIFVNTHIQKIVVANRSAFQYYDYNMKCLQTIEYPFYPKKNIPTAITNHRSFFLNNGDVIFWSAVTERFELLDYKQQKIVALSSVPQHNYYMLGQLKNPVSFGKDAAQNIWYVLKGKDSLFCFDAAHQATYAYALAGEAKNITWVGGPLLFPDNHTMLMGYSHKDAALIYRIAYDSLMSNRKFVITAKNVSGITTAGAWNFTDRDGNWWLASQNGLYLIRKGFEHFQRIDLPLPFRGGYNWQYITAIQPVDKNGLLITTKAEHCYYYNIQDNSVVHYLDTMPVERAWDNCLDDIFPLNKNRYLLRGVRDFMYENGHVSLGFKPENEFEQLVQQYANSGHIIDKEGNYWVCLSGKGLVRYNYEKKQLKVFAPDSIFHADDFSAITQDAAGNLYCASRMHGTVWKYDPARQQFFNISPATLTAAKADWTNSICADAANNVYVSNHQGILIIEQKTKKLSEINRKDGLPSNLINKMFCYKQHLYLSTENNLAILNIENRSIQRVRATGGLVDGIATQAYYLDSTAHRLYIGGKGCVYKINPDSCWEISHKAHIVINSVMVNNQPIADFSQCPSFEYTRNNISISVNSIDYHSEGSKKYYYNVSHNNAESGWIENPSKQFSFLNLGTGTYHISLRSKDGNNHWSANTASISFDILAPWYKRWWFLTLLLLSAATAISLIYRNKIKQIRRIEKIRDKISRDLHDDIGSTLSSINILSCTAQANLQNESNKKAKASLEKINERSQRLLDNMSDIIWNIRPGNDTIEEVMSRMREYATTQLEAKGIDYLFNFPKEKMDCTLTMEVKSNMYLIFKEAVNNLSKYADCTLANLSLTFDEKHIYLIVQDNGKGFDEAEITHRGGLRNMQQRTEEIKGNFLITTAKGVGTTISLTLPRYC
ncbi:MAG: hypothetical protein JSS64_02525 [Bacteroidetes bacterium]|nr:hypothetical protein [Bacteroidota bacterium]